jgi:hypothetical protein
MGLSFVPSVTICYLLFPRILKLGVLSCPDRLKVASSVSASSSSSFERKSQRTSLLSGVTCCYSKIYFLILNLERVRRIFCGINRWYVNCRAHCLFDFRMLRTKTPSFIPININDWSFTGHFSFTTPATPPLLCGHFLVILYKTAYKISFTT